MTQYRALVGIDYPPNKRAEAGDLVDDLPGASIKWLVAEGFIEPVDAKTKPSKADSDLAVEPESEEK